MSLSNSKVSEILFHTSETTNIIAENSPNMENCGNYCLSLDKTLMTRIHTQYIHSKAPTEYIFLFGKSTLGLFLL